jgi:hypothetical protein
MRANPTVLAIMLLSGWFSLPNDLSAPATSSPRAVAVAQSELDSAALIAGLSVTRQSWVREGGSQRGRPLKPLYPV